MGRIFEGGVLAGHYGIDWYKQLDKQIRDHVCV